MKMMNKEYVDLVKKYSFVDDAKIVGGNFIIYYTYKGVKKTKKLPIRVQASRLQTALRAIDKEMELSEYGKGKNQDIYIA